MDSSVSGGRGQELPGAADSMYLEKCHLTYGRNMKLQKIHSSLVSLRCQVTTDGKMSSVPNLKVVRSRTSFIKCQIKMSVLFWPNLRPFINIKYLILVVWYLQHHSSLTFLQFLNLTF